MAFDQNLTPPSALPPARFTRKRVAGQTLVLPDEDWLKSLVTSVQTFNTKLLNQVNNSGVLPGPTLASATTITVSSSIHHVTGSASISTITPVATFAGGAVYLINDGSWQFVSGGNIATPYIPGAGELVTVVYSTDTQKWYVPGQPASGGGGGGTAGPPTNAPTPNTIDIRVNTDGSVTYTIGWTYSQGANQATGFLVYVKEGTTAPTTSDIGLDVGLAQFATFSGFPSDVNYSFGVAAYRVANGVNTLGAIQSSASAPDWLGVNQGTPNYTGSIAGTTAATVVANAADGEVGFRGTVRYRSPQSPSNNITPDSFSHVTETDASISYSIGWTYVQGALQADGFIVFWKTGDTGTFDPVTDAHYAIGSTEQVVNSGADLFDYNSSASYTTSGTATFTWNTANSRLVITEGNASTLTRNGTSYADIAVAATMTQAESARLIARFQDANNFYFLRIEDGSSAAGQANTVTIFKRVGGVNTALSSNFAVTWTRGDAHTIKLSVIGTTLAAYFDNTLLGTVTDSSLASAGNVGLGAANTGGTDIVNDFAWGTLDSRQFTLRGIPSDRTLSFGVAAWRRTENGMEIGTIISSASAPDWEGVNQGTPNFTGNTFGVKLHSWTLSAAGALSTVGLVGQVGVALDGNLTSWAGVDPAYNGVSGFAYGLAYNLLVYDLVAESVLYAHCYDTENFGSAVANADLIGGTTTGSGAVSWGQPGKFGMALGTNGINSSNRGYWRTLDSATLYGGLQRVSVWFKKATTPAAAGTIVGLNAVATADSGFSLPALALNTNGTVSANAWNGSAVLTVTSTTNVCDGNWHQLNCRVNGTDFRLYVDGVQEGGTTVTAITSLTVGLGALYVHLGAGFSVTGDLFGQAFYDELLVADTNGMIANTLQSAEWDDRLGGASGTAALWHFQEVSTANAHCNARKAPRALANVLNAYGAQQSTIGDAQRYLILIHGSNEPQANRTVDNLPLALAACGATQFLFTAAAFRLQSAYALVGQPLIGEGNGFEGYAGTTDGDVNAVVKLSFQTLGTRVSGRTGTGWVPALIPGAPTNAPTTLAIGPTTSDTGQRQHKLTWAYTQPALSGTNAPADGFILYYQKTNTSNPTEQFIKLDKSALAYTFEWSLPAGSVVSYAIAAYRKTTSGIEVGTKVTTGVWQNVTASLYVQSLEPGAPTNSPTTLDISNTPLATGERTHKLTWAYSQGTFAADGFVLYYQKANTSNPGEQQIYLNNDVTAFTFEWSLAASSVVSYAITAFRRTINGIEETSKVTTGVWQNVPADQVVQTAGIGDNQVTVPKFPVSVTVDPGQTGATEMVISGNAAGLKLQSIGGGTSMSFETTGGTSRSSILGSSASTATVEWVPGSNGVGILRLGDSSLHWNLIELEATSSILINSSNVGFISLDDVTLNHPFLELSCNGVTLYVGRSGNLELNPGAGDVQWGKAMLATGGGATATLGTVGGSGPGTAAQNGWMRLIDAFGSVRFVPIWA